MFFIHYSSAGLLITALAVLLATAPASAIEFKDVSDVAGFREVGPTSGSAWGDLNDDGWPDLWVSNHHGKPPTLYLNNGNGSFTDITHTLDVFKQYSDRDWPDYHGGAWGDVDNDGDLDFLVITGGGAGRGVSASHFFENKGAEGFVERGAELGLDYPLGRGRTPLWVDINNDARLDVVVMNKHRKTAPSTLFMQQDDGTFLNSNGLPVHTPGFAESLWQDIVSWLSGPPAALVANAEFAQLAMLPTGDKTQPVLVTYQQPTQLFQFNKQSLTPLQEAMPAEKGVQDAVIADFDGNGVNDWLLIKSRPGVQEVLLTAPEQLLANFAGTKEKPKEIQVHTSGNLRIHYHRVWMDPTDPRLNEVLPLYLGANRKQLDSSVIELSTDAPELHSRAPQTLPERGVSVDYNPESEVWTLKNSSGPLNIELTSTAEITQWETKGFKSSTGELADAIVFNDASGLSSDVRVLAKSPCQAAAAADFDNDGDTDVYLLCATPASNAPDRLLTNRGDGTFEEALLPSYPGRGSQVAAADFNNDGFIDLALTNGAGPLPFAEQGRHMLLQNKGNDNHWLQISLIGTQSNRDGTGAVVVLQTGDKEQTQVQGGELHSLTQNDARLHFGLGDNTKVDKLEIRWPSGLVQTFTDVNANQILRVVEG